MQITFDIPSRGAGLPRSLPFRQVTKVSVTIQREPDDPQDDILFEVSNCSALNGAASTIIGANSLSETGVIEIRGDAQTEPDHSRHLVIRASLAGSQVGASDGFSVCAHPTCVENGPQFDTIALGHVDSDNSMVGLKVWMRLPSDSGDGRDLSNVREKEVVAYAHDFTGAANNAPESGNSNWQWAHQVEPDRHRLRADVMNVIDQTQLNGTEGGWSNDQLDIFYCQRCGMVEAAPAPIPHSGYRVTRVISTTADNHLQLVLRKYPRECDIGGFQTAGGPSEAIQVIVTVPKQQVATE
ncbi:hypothetical protein [Lignipirellula cremea]|uniref:Uncharacterized protein n=1 Tax=Lignipirellula cremea TaxID=2528010 RepID=A0A518E3D2_9BACT|nr:hypothetical protein [Lignipirellula cremea]QDU98599.1 hypothetical protein Pla8534_64700 [Lignipirellula cremea]